jgi:predicted ArsR family transcriptional regulator
MDPGRAAQLTAVAALAEPTRRRLYEHVVRQPSPVSRDEAAATLDVPRATVAFHLDRLVDAGLLDVDYERRSGRTGPGAGRPAKLYRRAACSMSVSLPERRYDLAGQLLAAALEAAEGSGEPPSAVLDRLARSRGRSLGEEAARAAGTSAAPRDAALRVLEEHGFEPRVEADGVALANCPFHTLAQQHTQLVCGMNLRLLEGLLDGLPGVGLVAHLEPAAGACCVRMGADPGA